MFKYTEIKILGFLLTHIYEFLLIIILFNGKTNFSIY